MTQAINNKTYIYKHKHLDILDIFRILLSLLIMTNHIWVKYYISVFGENRSFGYIAVEAFFMISGFFIARSALKENSITWYKYLWQRTKKFLPLLLFVVGVGLVLFAISSCICLAPNVECFTAILFNSWFLYFLVIFGSFIYFFIRKWKGGAILIGTIIAIVSYVGLYFWAGCLDPIKFSDSQLINGFSIAGSWALRSISAIFLGSALFYLSIKVQDWNPSNLLRTIFTIVALTALAALLFLTIKFGKTGWDFMSILLIFIILLVIFFYIGLFTKFVKIGDRACSFISSLSLTTYLFHGSMIAFMYTFAWNNAALWQEQWWLITHGVTCYVASPIISIGINKIYSLIMKKIHSKKMYNEAHGKQK